jgi:hypothetical protein
MSQCCGTAATFPAEEHRGIARHAVGRDIVDAVVRGAVIGGGTGGIVFRLATTSRTAGLIVR